MSWHNKQIHRVTFLIQGLYIGVNDRYYRTVFSRAVVTEEEVSLALAHGEDITTPPSTVQDQLSTNGMGDVDTENDPLNYNMEETK